MFALVLCGTATNAGVETTAREAYQHGYDQIFDELMETIAEMLERMLTPAEGVNLAAGKAISLRASLLRKRVLQKR